MSALALSCLVSLPLVLGQASSTESFAEVLLTQKPKDAMAWRAKLAPVKPIDIASLARVSDLENLPALRIRLPKEKTDVLIDRDCWASNSLYRQLVLREVVTDLFKSNGFQSVLLSAESGSQAYKKAYKVLATGSPGLESQGEGLPSGEIILCPAVAGYLTINGEEKRITGVLPPPEGINPQKINPIADFQAENIRKPEFQVTGLMDKSLSFQALRLAGDAWHAVYRRFADLAEQPSLYGGPPPPKQQPVAFSALPSWKQKALLNYLSSSLNGPEFKDREAARKLIMNSKFRQGYVGVAILYSVPSQYGSIGGGTSIYILSRRG